MLITWDCFTFTKHSTSRSYFFHVAAQDKKMYHKNTYNEAVITGESQNFMSILSAPHTVSKITTP